jgi:hypothetical protein
MEVESSNKWKGDTVNFVLEDNIYLRLTPDVSGEDVTWPLENVHVSPTVVWYKSENKGGFQHVYDDRKLNEAWEAYELQ